MAEQLNLCDGHVGVDYGESHFVRTICLLGLEWAALADPSTAGSTILGYVCVARHSEQLTPDEVETRLSG